MWSIIMQRRDETVEEIRNISDADIQSIVDGFFENLAKGRDLKDRAPVVSERVLANLETR